MLIRECYKIESYNCVIYIDPIDLYIDQCNCILYEKHIKLQPVPPSMPLEALCISKTKLIVPLVALTGIQVVILYLSFFSVFARLTTPLDIFSPNLVCSSIRPI